MNGIPNKTLKELMQSTYKLTERVMSDLTEAFRNDFTVEEACLYSGISKDTYYEWEKQSDEFTESMERAKQFIAIASKKNIARAVIDSNSVEDSWKYLERRQKSLYSQRKEVTGEDGTQFILNTISYKDLDKNREK